MPAHPLTTAPQSALDQGRPRFGTYQGLVGQADWTQLKAPYQRSWWWRLFHHKQWQYAAIFTSEIALGMAVVHIGYASNGFLYLFDRRDKRMLVDRSQVMPVGSKIQVGLPGEGADTYFRASGLEMRLERPLGSTRFQLTATSHDGLEVEAELDMALAPPPMTAIAPIPKAVANCTQKHACIPVSGQLRFGDRHYNLADGIATLDHTNGLLARETSWRWASGHSAAIGFNLVDGFNDNIENVLWLGGELFSVGEARFAFDVAAPLKPWRITTVDGLLDLTFTPEGMRQKDENLIVALSRYVQPIGTFSGTLRTRPDGSSITLSDIPGVTEDHQARW